MSVDVSNKGDDSSLKSLEQAFVDVFRTAVLSRMASLSSDQSVEFVTGVVHELEARAAAHDAGLARLKSLIGAVDKAAPEMLRELIREYFTTAYDMFQQCRSAITFYHLSEDLLRAVTANIVGRVVAEMAVPSGKTPAVAVIALGPAGRQEFFPFCHVQMLLIHEDLEPSLAEAVGSRLHGAVEAIGLFPDVLVTPRNPEWRGTSAEWLARLDIGLKHGDDLDLIQLLRLADQTVLFDSNGLGRAFRKECFRMLSSSRAALNNLVGRITSLSSGSTLLGGARLLRSGPHAGMFNLLDHALLPLSSCITALSLLYGIESSESYRRIGELHEKGKLYPSISEQLREDWHLFNGLHLLAEAEKHPQWDSQDVLWLSLFTKLSVEQQRFVESLKTVSQLQRYVESCFKHWEDPVPC